MKHFESLVVAAALLIPVMRAAPSLSWDKAPDVVEGDSATVITKAGKQYKAKGRLSFTPSEVTILSSGVSVPRQDVKEIVIRQKWDKCCEALWYGAEMVYGGGQLMGTDFAPVGFMVLVIGLPVAAVTLPPALVIQAFRRWTTHTSYKVIP